MNHETKHIFKWFSSIRAKIVFLTVFTILITLLANLFIMLPETQKSLKQSIENNLYDLGVSYCQLLDDTLLFSDKDTLTYNELESLLSNVKVRGLDSSYAYLVDASGTILYHPTQKKVGQLVENSYILNVCAAISSGKLPTADVVNYEYRGGTKYASYAVSAANDWVLVISADEDEVFSSLNASLNKMFAISLGLSLLLALLSFFFSSSICNPLYAVTRNLTKISQLDFREEPSLKRLCERPDETGTIGRSISTMRQNLFKIIAQINTISLSINQTAHSLNQISIDVNEHSSNNSATTEELAAGMQETAATTDTISQNINLITTKTEHITKQSIDATTLSTKLLERSAKLSHSTEQTYKNTMALYQDVKDKSSLALMQAESAHKINELTTNITALAQQTSLLALNASIEAARAGESGRGFAVVADQISKLATESSQTSQSITAITSEVYTAVANMSDCLHQTLDFLENVVTLDYKQFIDAGNEYTEDATQITKAMNTIHLDISALKDIMNQMADAIVGINTTINEAAIGVSDIASKTTDVVSLTSETAHIATNNISDCENLTKLVNQFQMD